jgi:hypothetical protein
MLQLHDAVRNDYNTGNKLVGIGQPNKKERCKTPFEDFSFVACCFVGGG